MVFDPLCGRKVNKKKASSATYRDKTFYFCSPSCQLAFERLSEPLKEKVYRKGRLATGLYSCLGYRKQTFVDTLLRRYIREITAALEHDDIPRAHFWLVKILHDFNAINTAAIKAEQPDIVLEMINATSKALEQIDLKRIHPVVK
jgi:YHS domain-containing protein